MSPALSAHQLIWKKKQEGQDGPVSLTWLPDKFVSVGLSVQEKKFNIEFQDGGHLGFPIRTILATFDLQATSIFPWSLSQLPFWVKRKSSQ